MVEAKTTGTVAEVAKLLRETADALVARLPPDAVVSITVSATIESGVPQ